MREFGGAGGGGAHLGRKVLGDVEDFHAKLEGNVARGVCDRSDAAIGPQFQGQLCFNSSSSAAGKNLTTEVAEKNSQNKRANWTVPKYSISLVILRFSVPLG